ncbi:MAG: type II toxin-antitoxin system RelE/ParE family toxin [Myxococcales bacterium]|nr:type II toxin-antitoxin system RelE/ParE family toxin [Myxococcales bacterium]
MAGFRITKAARRDLIEIGRHTLQRWGADQRRRYLTQLDARFRWLARNPELGTSSDEIKRGYWRYREGRHVIYYRPSADGVDIIRVLHARMLPTHHL